MKVGRRLAYVTRGEDKLRQLEERLSRQLKALSDRVSQLSNAGIEYHYSADESTCYLAYAHSPAYRVSLRAQHVLDMDTQGLEATAQRVTNLLDEMELERQCLARHSPAAAHSQCRRPGGGLPRRGR